MIRASMLGRTLVSLSAVALGASFFISSTALANAPSYRSVMIVNPEVLDALRYIQQPAPAPMPARDYRPIIVHVPQNGPVSPQEMAEYDTYGVSIVPGNEQTTPVSAAPAPPPSSTKVILPLETKPYARTEEKPVKPAPATRAYTRTNAVPPVVVPKVDVSQETLPEIPVAPPTPVAIAEIPTAKVTLPAPALPKQRPAQVPLRQASAEPQRKPEKTPTLPVATAEISPKTTAPKQIAVTKVSQGILGTENTIASLPKKEVASTTNNMIPVTAIEAKKPSEKTKQDIKKETASEPVTITIPPVTAAPKTQPTPAAPPPAVTENDMFNDVAPALDTVFSIVFSAEEKTLPEISKTRLLEIAQALNEEHPRATLRIRAYAKPKNNDPGLARKLSLERAIAVRDFMMQSGISADRIQVQALGLPERQSPLSNRVEVVFFNTPAS